MGHLKAQTPDAHHFDNQYLEFQDRKDYYNWKVYLVASPAYLNSISEVVYYLDPTFSYSTRKIKADPENPNFSLCCNGWGEFQLRIKIVFKDRKKEDLYENYNLILTNTAKRNPNYTCNF